MGSVEGGLVRQCTHFVYDILPNLHEVPYAGSTVLRHYWNRTRVSIEHWALMAVLLRSLTGSLALHCALRRLFSLLLAQIGIEVEASS